MEKAGLLLQPSSVSGVPLVSGLTEDILSTFCGTLMVHYVKLMMRIFEFGFLQFGRYVYCQYVSCVKRFTTYGHYAGEVENIIMRRLAVLLSLKSLRQK